MLRLTSSELIDRPLASRGEWVQNTKPFCGKILKASIIFDTSEIGFFRRREENILQGATI